MIASIFFLFSFLLCFSSFLLIYKTDRVLSFIRSMVVCYIAQLCIGAFLALPLSLFSVPINIITMGILYLVLSLLAFFYIFYTKQRQKYKFEFFDLITAVLLLLVILVVIWRVFSFQLNLTYYNSDPGVHFSYAMNIVRTGKLGRMYFAPLYNAMFIEMLQPIFSGIDSYKAFILADSFSNFISGMMFYVLIVSTCKSTKIKWLSPIFTLFYFVGWPLYNYVVGGFVYWGVSITLTAFGLYLLFLYHENTANRKPLILLLILTLYCIAMCYMLFVPYIAVLFALALLALSWDNIKKMDKRILIGIVGSAIVLSVTIFCFAFFTFFHGDLRRMLSSLAKEGGIHKSFYRDFIFFLPFIFYLGSRLKRRKEFHLNFFLLMIYAILILATLPLCFTGIMSSYYYYKLYFLLWLLVWLVTADAITHILEESHAWFTGYLAMLAFMFVYTFSPLEDYIINKGLMNYAYTEFPMYSVTGSYIKSPEPTRYTDDFWEIIHFSVENGNYETVPLVGAPYDYIYLYWYEAITGYKCVYAETTNNFEGLFIDTDYQDSPAFILMKDSEYYEIYHNLLSAYPVLFENDFAIAYAAK